MVLFNLRIKLKGVGYKDERAEFCCLGENADLYFCYLEYPLQAIDILKEALPKFELPPDLDCTITADGWSERVDGYTTCTTLSTLDCKLGDLLK